MPRPILCLYAIALGCVTTAAYAAPVTLTCKQDGGDQTLQLVFDEDAKTAQAGDDPQSDATFTDSLITWGELDVKVTGWEFHKNYSLNRDTGVLDLQGALKADSAEQWARLHQTFNCAVSKKLF
jgi:hypothetical protein